MMPTCHALFIILFSTDYFFTRLLDVIFLFACKAHSSGHDLFAIFSPTHQISGFFVSAAGIRFHYLTGICYGIPNEHFSWSIRQFAGEMIL